MRSKNTTELRRRALVTIAVAALLSKPRASAYVDAWAPFLPTKDRRTERLLTIALPVLDVLTVAALVVPVTRGSRTRWALGPASFMLNRWIGAKGLPGRWGYDAFLEPLMWLVSADARAPGTHAIPFSSMCRVLLFGVYAQAGASKLLHGSNAWIIRGDALHTFLSQFGRDAVRPDGPNTPALRMATRAVPLAELLVLPLAIAAPPPVRRTIAAGTVAFHAAVWFALDISFWQLFASIWVLELGQQADRSDVRVLADALRWQAQGRMTDP